MTPFHPKLRRALLHDSEHHKQDVFKITDDLIQSLASKNVPNDILRKIEPIKNKEFRGKEKFSEALKMTIKEKQTYNDYEKLLLEHVDRTGLTSERLLEYEGHVAQLHYLLKYRDPHKPFMITNLLRSVRTFPGTFMPNFDIIREQWVKNQENAIKRKYHDLNPLNLIKLSLKFLWIWYLAAAFCKIFKFAKFRFCRQTEGLVNREQ